MSLPLVSVSPGLQEWSCRHPVKVCGDLSKWRVYENTETNSCYDRTIDAKCSLQQYNIVLVPCVLSVKPHFLTPTQTSRLPYLSNPEVGARGKRSPGATASTRLRFFSFKTPGTTQKPGPGQPKNSEIPTDPWVPGR